MGGMILISSCSDVQQKVAGSNEMGVKSEKSQGADKIDVKMLIGNWEDTSLAKLSMMLLEDGTARSTSSKTLIYTNWRVEGNKLIMTAKSIGNGISTIGDETYTIVKLNDKKLILKLGDYVAIFVRKPGC